MAVYNNFEDYKEEIELSCVQNHGVEIELYSLIAAIIRECCPDISLRDVSARRSIKNETFELRSVGGFPDFAVLTRSISDFQKLGCIEAKNTFEVFDDYKEQIECHRKTYEKVLYTNGLEWMFWDDTGKNHPWTIYLGYRKGDSKSERLNSSIIWEESSKWEQLLYKIKSIEWT